jgi:hypothetical protein
MKSSLIFTIRSARNCSSRRKPAIDKLKPLIARTAACVAALFLFPAASAGQNTIQLKLSAGDALSLDATVTVLHATFSAGQVVLEGNASGTVVITGDAFTIQAQPFTVTANVSCKSGAGTLTLSTTPLVVARSTGVTVTVGGETITATASCGRRPSVTATIGPASVTFSDGTVLTTTQCGATLSSTGSTEVGRTICTVKNLVCELGDAIAGLSISDVISLLNQVLTQVQTTLG